MSLTDFLDAVVLAILGGMMLVTLAVVAVVLHVVRHRPRDWMPCEAWIVVGLVALTWACKVLA
jgi:hypothetical protein